MSQSESITESPVSSATIWKTQCSKNIHELNRETAIYWSLTVNFGTRADSKNIQAQLKQSRTKAIELAKQGCCNQFPSNKRLLKECLTAGEFERLGSLLASVIELLITLLHRNLSLLDKWDSTSKKYKINTGLKSYKIKRDRSSRSCSLTVTSTEDPTINQESEVLFLLSHIKDLRVLVNKIYESSDIQPWDIEPPPTAGTTSKLDPGNKTLEGVESGTTLIAVRSATFVQSRKCKFLLVTSLTGLITLIIFSVLLLLLT